MKLGIIVPYRARPTHLRKFKEYIETYFNDKDISYHLIIVEQNDNLPFNRGKLLNIGFEQALKKRCEYVVFHDIDMLPVDVDYSASDVPIHLATNFEGGKQEVWDTYFGGVTIFPIDSFKKVNGYSNEYWGWGFEDDDLLLRLTEQQIGTDFSVHKSEKEYNSGLYIHGDESYIQCYNTIDIENSFTIHCTFKPDEIIPEYNKPFDEYCVWSLPGWDTTISYSSFNRYKFECWDTEKECYSITSEHSPPKLTRITVTYDRSTRVLVMYQDGEEVGRKVIPRKLLNTDTQFFYIGTGVPRRKGDIKGYRGLVKDFAYWNVGLSGNEVMELHENHGVNYLTNTGQYSSCENLKIYYDFKHLLLERQWEYEHGKVIDLVNHQEERFWPKTFNCIPRTEMENEDIKVNKPFRRPSTFKLLKHAPTGYNAGRWKTESTRLNQIKFFDQIRNNKSNLLEDGLTTLHYEIVEEKNVRNYLHLKVTL